MRHTKPFRAHTPLPPHMGSNFFVFWRLCNKKASLIVWRIHRPLLLYVNFNECWQLVLLIKSLDSFLSARRRPRREQAWTAKKDACPAVRAPGHVSI